MYTLDVITSTSRAANKLAFLLHHIIEIIQAHYFNCMCRGLRKRVSNMPWNIWAAYCSLFRSGFKLSSLRPDLTLASTKFYQAQYSTGHQKSFFAQMQGERNPLRQRLHELKTFPAGCHPCTFPHKCGPSNFCLQMKILFGVLQWRIASAAPDE